MSILKALQKHTETQDIADIATAAEAKVVPFDKNARRSNAAPELFQSKSLKIGSPSSASNGQTEPATGMALLDNRIDTAGATLDAVGSTRSMEHKRLPEFSSWNVELERVEPRLVAVTQPHSNYCEEYRSLRTHILHKTQRKGLKSIVVASTTANEGKSITALNLSWLLAQTDGVNALLIDSDLRNPSLTDYLGIETDLGLSDVLSDKATLKDSIIRLQPAGLHLLPGGEARSDVAELISGPKFREILREAREMFDYVIIDAPPLAIFTDATVLINHADGALMVVRAGKAKYSAVDRVLEQIPRERMLGVVLNNSKDELKESQYPYGYYYKKRTEG
jgi:capsular exopolysaccharide synthesis family protein